MIPTELTTIAGVTLAFGLSFVDIVTRITWGLRKQIINQKGRPEAGFVIVPVELPHMFRLMLPELRAEFIPPGAGKRNAPNGDSPAWIMEALFQSTAHRKASRGVRLTFRSVFLRPLNHGRIEFFPAHVRIGRRKEFEQLYRNSQKSEGHFRRRIGVARLTRNGDLRHNTGR